MADQLYRYLSSIKNKNLKSISFIRLLKFTTKNGEILKDTLKNVENVNFVSCDAISFDNIRRFCPSLKNLYIGLSEFPNKHCPSVECIWKDNTKLHEMEAFFRINPQIKKVSMPEKLGQFMDMIVEADMKFDELKMYRHQIENVDVVRLNN